MKSNRKTITEDTLIELFSFFSQMDECMGSTSDFLSLVDSHDSDFLDEDSLDEDLLDEDSLGNVAGGLHPIPGSRKD